jgi:hypothetical protein
MRAARVDLVIGVGNPQGAVVTSTKRAKFGKPSTKFSFQGDRWDSHRAALDHNQPLIANRLAFRLNGLFDRQREFRGTEGKHQERVTLSLVAQPWKNTKVTVNHENYDLAINNASLVWGFDGAALAWMAAGKPVADNDPRNYLLTTNAQTQILVRGLNLTNPLVGLGKAVRVLPREDHEVRVHRLRLFVRARVHNRSGGAVWWVDRQIGNAVSDEARPGIE